MHSAYLVHAVTGRARIRIPARRGDEAYFAGLKIRLAECPLLDSIEINARAASLLVTFADGCGIDTLASQAREQGLFELRKEAPPVKPLGTLLTEQMQQADRLIGAGAQQLDAQSRFVLLFLGLGLQQLVRGQVLQPAIPLLWKVVDLLRNRGARSPVDTETA